VTRSSDFQKHLESIDSLVKEIEASADPAMRAKSAELLEAVMALHGTAIEKILEIARSKPGTLELLLRDELIASVLVLYDLHPLDLEARVRQAVETLRAGGVQVEVAGIVDGAVRVRLRAEGCGSAGIRQRVEDAFYRAAPDLTTLIIEEAAAAAFVPVASLSNGHGSAAKFGGT